MINVSDRQQRERKVRMFYQRLGFDNKRTYVFEGKTEIDAYPCLYCGAIGTTDDHTIPVSIASSLVDLGHIDTVRDQCFIVPCCKQCNGWLGSQVFPTLDLRIAYIKKRLADRFGELRHLPEWTDEELAELGRCLKDFIAQGEALRRHYEDRLFWNYKEGR